MLKRIRSATLAAAFVAFLVTMAEGQITSHKLPEPAAVPLDFLSWIDRDAEWLRDSLTRQGVRSGFEISDNVLEASTVEALRSAHRVHSFAYLAVSGLRPPYLDLSVKSTGKSSVRCVTLFPRSIAPDIGAMDFERASFPASEADPDFLKLCRVQPKKGADHSGLDRNAFREKFFDAAGDLKSEFSNRNTDTAFIAEAIDLGFQVLQRDVTGRLRLSAE